MTKNNTSKSKEEHKTIRYIVEAPAPKQGQKASSGGIRKNGKITSQFKNPVPYIEPPATPTVTPNTELIRKEQMQVRIKNTLLYLLEIGWEEFGEPVLRSGLRKLETLISNKIEGISKQTTPHITTSDRIVIDVDADEIEATYEDSKIIPFPNRKAV